MRSLGPSDGLVQKFNGIAPQQSLRLLLGVLPNRCCLLQQTFTLSRQPKGLRTTIVVSNHFQPALGFHPFHVAAQR